METQINIPIYRALKLGTKDEYVEGFLYQDIICYVPSDGFKPDEYKKAVDTETWFIMDNLSNTSMIDTTTISIHFPNMLAKDSDRYNSSGEKDLRVFASLQLDGKGGDILLEESRLMCTLKIDESAFREFTAIHTINGNRFTNEKILSDIGSYRDKYFKGYDIMIYDFFMMKKRNIKIIGIQK